MKIQRGTKKEWSEILQANNKISFFSSPEWFDLVSSYNEIPYEISKVELNGSTYLLPVFKMKRRIFSIYSNSLFGTYCGLVSKSTLTCDQESNIVKNILGNRNYNYTGCPYNTDDCAEANSEFTQVIRLSEFDSNQVSKNHRRSISKAKNNQLTVQCSESIVDWQVYYKIYEQVTKDRGNRASNHYKWRLFQLIFELPSTKRKLWLIKDRQDIIGGGLFFYQNQVNYWHGCNSIRSKNLGGSHFLHNSVIEDSKTQGYTIYDFNPSGGHKGVELFKSGFNSEKIYFTSLEHQNKYFQNSAKLYSFSKSIFR